MRMYIDWFDTERISTGKISIVGATTPHTSSSRGGIKTVIRESYFVVLEHNLFTSMICTLLVCAL